MHMFLGDLRHGARLLRRSPGFTLIAIAALAVGIGANLTIFGFASAMLLSPPGGVSDPGRLVRAYTNRFSNTPFGEYEAYRARNHTFLDLAGFRAESMRARTSGAPEQLFGFAVSGNYFTALGVSTTLGRPIAPNDERDAGSAGGVVLLSDGFWRRRFAADPQVIGRPFVVNGRAATIIGVTPAGFTGTLAPLVPDIWIPLRQSPRVDEGSVQMIGRLRPGVTIGQAQADLTTLASQLADARADTRRPMVTVYAARSVAPELAVPAAVFAAMLLVVVGLVLLIACVSIANLLLARSAARQREIGVRLALGATRGRLVRQMLTESLLLSVAGAAAAATLAYAASGPVAAAVTLVPIPVPVALDFALDWRVMAGAIALSVMTTMGFGLVPALQSSRGDVVPALKEGAATAAPARARVRAAFVAAQAALSTLLLVMAALLVRAVFSAQTLDRGFVSNGVLTASVELTSAGYTAERGLSFYEGLLDRLAETPGIVSATLADIVPLTLSNRVNPMVSEPGGTGAVMVYSNNVSSGHFRTLGIPLLAGRDFDTRDRERAIPVAIINETLARRFWPAESPIGKRLRNRDGRATDPWLEVVGVARDSKYVTIGEEPKAFLYRPFAQAYRPSATLIVKSAGRPMDALTAVRGAVQTLDPDLPVFGVTTLEEATAISLLPVTIAASVAGSLGVLALVLGAIGLYGVMSAVARQRTREIGIRMALGAHAGAVVRLVTVHGMRWTVMGITLGLAVSVGVAHLISGFLYGVSSIDPAAFTLIPLVLASAAYAACYLPARRASRIDPLAALRDE